MISVRSSPGEHPEKAGKLTNEEYEIKKSYVEKFPSNDPLFCLMMNYAYPAVVSHHERYDGRVIPEESGEEIPFSWQGILAVCDSFDAMILKRAYKEPLSVEYAMGELRKNSEPSLIRKRWQMLLLNRSKKEKFPCRN